MKNILTDTIFNKVLIYLTTYIHVYILSVCSSEIWRIFSPIVALHIHIYVHMQYRPVHSKTENDNPPFHQPFSTKCPHIRPGTYMLQNTSHWYIVFLCQWYMGLFYFFCGAGFKYELISNLMYLQELYIKRVQKLLMKFICVHERI